MDHVSLLWLIHVLTMNLATVGTARVKLLVASVMRPMAAYLRGARP